MGTQESDGPAAPGAGLEFYFNADDTLRSAPGPGAPWEAAWIEPERTEASALQWTGDAPRRRRGSSLLIGLGVALAAALAAALAWGLTPGRWQAPDVVSTAAASLVQLLRPTPQPALSVARPLVQPPPVEAAPTDITAALPPPLAPTAPPPLAASPPQQSAPLEAAPAKPRHLRSAKHHAAAHAAPRRGGKSTAHAKAQAARRPTHRAVSATHSARPSHVRATGHTSRRATTHTHSPAPKHTHRSRRRSAP